MINQFLVDEILINGLKEDITYNDITTDNLIDKNSKSVAFITFKEDGVICGTNLIERLYELLDINIDVELLVNEGEYILKGKDVIKLSGSTRNLLKGERLGLNILQRMSGIATLSKLFSDKVKALDVKIVDTRKTTPNLRIIEKYAVTVGNCFNHRYNLSDSVMIKDNHIKAAGSIKNAVKIIRDKIGHTIKIEVEVTNLDELREALNENADIIMLDNMDNKTMLKAVEINNKKAILEASGGVNINTVYDIALTGVDIISVGALTHSAKALDISMNIL
ncbi:carboxylating nicotinate-nucleotide diphosphorylase [Helicovermis profundi]|uniref:Probable nicotinate-nucleotide pyrophosphorylase [carboxylating] n=1 Tax=Helicovermis profundi TaxID=3065157 RepID=A0AAU9E0F3_9FIRM|nr:carboxylating nicotinate-nucleotide diphosphorylase [Clostridia bacterium S502]